MAAYRSGLGWENLPGEDLKPASSKGEVSLTFDTSLRTQTMVSLSRNLETGYVTNSISDDLGLFPEGIQDGDFPEASVVQNVLREQVRRDDSKQSRSLVHRSRGPSGLRLSGYLFLSPPRSLGEPSSLA